MNHTSSPIRISYWIRPNRYAGTCVACAQEVKAHKGWTQKDGTTWQTICSVCVRANAKYIPMLGEDGTPRHTRALNDSHRGGAWYSCQTCGMDVALVKSPKTGKWYFCDIVETNAHYNYAATHQPHSAQTCERRQADNAEFTNDVLYKQELDQAWKALQQTIEVGEDGKVDPKVTQAVLDRYTAMMNEISAKYGKEVAQ